MKVIPASFEILSYTPNLEQLIEMAGRVCYKSEDRITSDSSTAFIQRMHASKHESVLEHGAITVRFITDRGITHEMVRHRISSFSQESTRYCNYGKKDEIVVIDPRIAFPDMTDVSYAAWQEAMRFAEDTYLNMVADGVAPQLARSVLPNSLKTEIVWTANPREWLHVFRLRCSKQAHPQIREVMIPLRAEFVKMWPAVFGGYDE